MSRESHHRKLENLYLACKCQKNFMPKVKIGEGTAEITLPVKEEYFHALSAVHGHVYFKLLDDSSFFAVNSLVEDVFVLTVSYQVYFTRPVTSGEMHAKGTVVHQSKNLYIAESVILNSEGKEIGRGSGTFMKSKSLFSSLPNYAE